MVVQTNGSIEILDECLLESLKKLKSGEVIGKVHSIFNEVVNFRTLDGSVLFSLATKEVVQSPRMMKTKNTNRFYEMTPTLEVGDYLYLKDDESIEVNSWSWTYANATSWNRTIQTISYKELQPTRSQLKVLNDFIEEMGATSGSFYAWKKWNEPNWEVPEAVVKNFYFAPFVKSIERLDRQVKDQQLKTMLDGFIGLGIGLTPSGDDFITGVLATWQYFRFPLAEEALADYQEEWITDLQGKTTDVSYFMLKHCLKGEVNEALLRLLEHFNDNPAPYLQDVLAIGSTSGTDMLTGVSFAYEQLLRNKEELL